MLSNYLLFSMIVLLLIKEVSESRRKYYAIISIEEVKFLASMGILSSFRKPWSIFGLALIRINGGYLISDSVYANSNFSISKAPPLLKLLFNKPINSKPRLSDNSFIRLLSTCNRVFDLRFDRERKLIPLFPNISWD